MKWSSDYMKVNHCQLVLISTSQHSKAFKVFHFNLIFKQKTFNFCMNNSNLLSCLLCLWYIWVFNIVHLRSANNQNIDLKVESPISFADHLVTHWWWTWQNWSVFYLAFHKQLTWIWSEKLITLWEVFCFTFKL